VELLRSRNRHSESDRARPAERQGSFNPEILSSGQCDTCLAFELLAVFGQTSIA